MSSKILTSKLQEMILNGYKPPTKEELEIRKCISKKYEPLPMSPLIPITTKNKEQLMEEEASMNNHMIKLKRIIKSLSLLEDGMLYIGNMKPISFEPIYVVALMQAKLYKFKNRLASLTTKNKKHLQNLITVAYENIIDQCLNGPQDNKKLTKIVKEVSIIDDLMIEYYDGFVKKKINKSYFDGINICPWFHKKLYLTNNLWLNALSKKKKMIPDTSNLRLKKFNKKLISIPQLPFINKIKKEVMKINELEREKKLKIYNRVDKNLFAFVSMIDVGMQYYPALSGSLPTTDKLVLEDHIKNDWISNKMNNTYRISINEPIPQNHFRYEINVRDAATDVMKDINPNENTKETQTKVCCDCNGDYEYTVMNVTYTKERTVEEKAQNEMIKSIGKKPVILLNEFDIFETISSTEIISTSSNSTVIEDSDGEVALSSVRRTPYFKEFKMSHRTDRQEGNHKVSREKKSPLQKEEAIIHKNEILGYIKELSSALTNVLDLGKNMDCADK